MTLLVVAVALLILDSTVRLYRKRAARRARWQLYALRDKLRGAGFEDHAVRESPLFAAFDQAISSIAAGIERGDISAWAAIGTLSQQRERDRLRKAVADRDQWIAQLDVNGFFSEMRESVNAATAGFLIRRHPVALTSLALYVFYRSGGLRTIKPVVEEIVYEHRDDDCNGHHSMPAAA